MVKRFSDVNSTRYILALAYRLERDAEGNVVVGHGTKEACDHALSVARSVIELGGTAVIVVAAGAARNFDYVLMSEVMRTYIRSQHDESEPIRVEALRSADFTTAGELLAFAQYLREITENLISGQHIDAAICVKAWHAPRARRLADKIFDQVGISDISVQFQTYPLKLNVREFIHEIGGIVLLKYSVNKALQLSGTS